MDITPELLRQAMGCRRERAELFARALDDACDAYAMASPRVLAAYMAQLGHESGSLEHVREIWGPTDAQRRYERDFTAPWPEGDTQAWQSAFARNRLAWRLGNTEAGDGRRYCGHGPLQVTGRYNHRRTTQRLRQRFGADAVPDFEAEPELLELPRWGCLAACDYWRDKGLNALAETGSEADFEAITRAINGGLNGWPDRLHRWARAKSAINAALDLPVLTEPAALSTEVPPVVPPVMPPGMPPAVPPVPVPVPEVVAAPEPVAPAPSTAEADEAPPAVAPTSIADPIPITPKEAPMLPMLLQGLASAVISGFSSLAQEKLTKEIGRHTDKPEVAEQISRTVIDKVVQLTGKEDPIEAVAAAKTSPAIMAAVEESALDHLARLAPLLEQINALDQAQWQRDEDSRRAADDRAKGTPNDQDVFLTRAIVAMAIGLLAGGAVLIGVLSWLGKDVQTIVGFWVTFAAAVGAKFQTRYDHRYGSSSGSVAKDAVIDSLSRRK